MPKFTLTCKFQTGSFSGSTPRTQGGGQKARLRYPVLIVVLRLPVWLHRWAEERLWGLCGLSQAAIMTRQPCVCATQSLCACQR